MGRSLTIVRATRTWRAIPFSGYNQTLGQDIPYPSGLKNQFGGSVGGPVLKDKVFFFADYQGVRQKVGSTSVASVPTPLALRTCTGTALASDGTAGCDLSDYINPGNVGAGNVPANAPPTFAVFNNNQAVANTPLGAQFPNNIIPLSLVSAPAQKLFGLLLNNNFLPNHNTGVTGNYNGLYNNYNGFRGGIVQQQSMGRTRRCNTEPEDSRLRSFQPLHGHSERREPLWPCRRSRPRHRRLRRWYLREQTIRSRSALTSPSAPSW